MRFGIHRTKKVDKGTLVFLQELGFALQEELQQSPRASSLKCPTGDLDGFLLVEVTLDIDLVFISFMFFR